MIYIIRQRGTNIVKIGYCRNKRTGVFERLKSLKTGNPHQLDIEWVFSGTKIKERCLHFFCISRHIDGEWFRLTVDEARRLADKYGDWVPGREGITKMSAIHTLKNPKTLAKNRKRYAAQITAKDPSKVANLPPEAEDEEPVKTKEKPLPCFGKMAMGKKHKEVCQRVADKHKQPYGAYRCPYCQKLHLTTKLDRTGIQSDLVHVAYPSIVTFKSRK